MGSGKSVYGVLKECLGLGGLALALSEQVGRVIDRDNRDIVLVEESRLGQHRTHRTELESQVTGGESTYSNDDLGLNDLDLFPEKGGTRLDFVGLGVPVARRSTFDHVGDETLLLAVNASLPQ